MLYWAENNEALGAGMPLWAIMPGVCVALLGAAFALLNYAFDEISNPALRVRRLERARLREDRAGHAAVRPVAGRRRRSSRSRTSRSPMRPTPTRSSRSTVSTSSSRRGEFLAIVGESGCGKSTLLYAIARLLGAPMAARSLGGQRRLPGPRPRAARARRSSAPIRWRELSVVMQSAMNALNPVLTVAAQMRDACQAHSDMSSKEIAERSREVLRLVSIDPIHLHSYPHQLSGGMRQRAMIAMALLFTPDLIIMDEPTSALDVVAQRSLMVQIKELQERARLRRHLRHPRHVARQPLLRPAARDVRRPGRRARHRRRELFDRPLHPYSQGLLEAFPSHPRPQGAAAGHSRLAAGPRRIPDGLPLLAPLSAAASAETASCTRGRGAAPLESTGASSAASSRPDEAVVTETLLRTEGLTRHFQVGKLMSRQTLHAVDDVDLSIGRGEIVALVGESGSGKSTIARLLALVYEPTQRRDLVRGHAAEPASRTRKRASRTAATSRWSSRIRTARSTRRTGSRTGSVRGMKLHRGDRSQRRAAGRAQARARGRRARAGGRRDAEVSVRAERWPAPAGRLRAGARASAEADRRRRARLDARRLDPRRRPQSHERAARAGGRLVPLHHPRCRERALHRRPRARHVRGASRRGGPTEDVLQQPKHPYTQLLVSAVPDPRAELRLADASRRR